MEQAWNVFLSLVSRGRARMHWEIALCGVLMVAPVLGGWIIQATSYPVLFAVTAVSVALGLVLTFRLEEPRQIDRET